MWLTEGLVVGREVTGSATAVPAVRLRWHRGFHPPDANPLQWRTSILLCRRSQRPSGLPEHQSRSVVDSRDAAVAMMITYDDRGVDDPDALIDATFSQLPVCRWVSVLTDDLTCVLGMRRWRSHLGGRATLSCSAGGGEGSGLVGWPPAVWWAPALTGWAVAWFMQRSGQLDRRITWSDLLDAPDPEQMTVSAAGRSWPVDVSVSQVLPW